METITFKDPGTRTEGHIAVEITVDTKGGLQQIVGAKCSGTLFSGFETLLYGRNPLDAPLIIQHICGVYPIAHGQAAVQALENVSGWLPPTNARLLRNLKLGANFLQSHILHFYLQAVLDFVAGPATSPWSPAWRVDMRPGLDSVAANLPAALGARRRAHEMGCVFGDRMPGTNTFIPGGFTTVPNARDIDRYRQHLSALEDFIESTYLPDVQRLGRTYCDYFEIGGGCRNLLAYGAFEMNDANITRLFRSGCSEAGSFDIRSITASGYIHQAARSHQNDSHSNKDNSLTEGKGTDADYGDFQVLNALQLPGKPYETGPLARMWINGDYQRTISVMDRHVARALEAAKIASAMAGWLNELIPGQNAFDDSFTQHSGSGTGLSESPGGALGHRVNITDQKITDYLVVTPSCWNASRSADQQISGPMEQALIGTPIKIPEQPVEALRVIHSFDPCLSCTVQIMRPGEKQVAIHTEG